MLGAAHNRVRQLLHYVVVRQNSLHISPVHFSARKWSFFAGDNGYIDKMVKVSRTVAVSVRATRESVPGDFSRVRHFFAFTHKRNNCNDFAEDLHSDIRLYAQNLTAFNPFSNWNV